MKRIALACVGTVFVTLLASCGGGGGGEISDQARAELQPMVAEVRRTAESSDPDGAASVLAGLRQAVAALHARHEIDNARAEAILTAAARVEARLSLTPTTTAPPSSTTSPASPTAPTATTEPATSTSVPTPSTSPLTQPPSTATSTPATSAPEPTVDDRGRGNDDDGFEDDGGFGDGNDNRGRGNGENESEDDSAGGPG